MIIYISSRKLKIDSTMEIKLLNNFNIDLVTENDIVIGTGTVRDDLIIKNLVDRAVLPFIVSFSIASSFSPLLENLSLTIKRKITHITPELLDEIQTLRKSIESFEAHSTELLEEEQEIKELTNLALIQQIQLLKYFYKDGVKSEDKEKRRRSIYPALSHRGAKAFYLTLHDNDTLRVFKIERELGKDEQEFVCNMFRKNFETLMRAEKIELKNRYFSFEYHEITQKLNQDFLLIGMDDEYNFSTYCLYDIKNPKTLEGMSVYEVGSEIREIDEKGKLALASLRNIILNRDVDYQHLDVFLFSARHFKSVITSIDHNKQESFKQTTISDMFEKIYENIKSEERKTSLLRFALVSLMNDRFDSLTLKSHSHIFYDIHNGININAQLLKEVTPKNDEKMAQKKTLARRECIDEEQQELFDAFLEKNQNQKFIEVFLKSLLNMESNTQLKGKKTLRFVAMTTYLSSNEDAKTAYCLTAIIIFQTSPKNINNFFLALDNFIYLEEPITIEEYLKKTLPYQCKEQSKKVEITVNLEKFIKTKDALRQFKHRFSLQLLKVGNFYKLISKESTLDEIICTSFKNIRDKKLDTTELCQHTTTSDFLAIFFKGHSKKNCQSNLEGFLEENQILLEIY